MTYRRLLEDGASRLLQEDGASFQLAEQDGVPAALAGASVGEATSAGALTTAGSFPWTAVPSFGGAVQGAYWQRPGSTAVRDNQGAHDLLLLGTDYAGGTNTVHLATSTDGGSSWAQTASAVNLGLGNFSSGDGIEYAVQDSGGVLHATIRLVSGSCYYFRAVLTRDGSGHVTGITSLSTAVQVTNLTGPNGGDFRAAPHIVFDATPAERLVVSVFGDGANNGQYVWLAKASSLTPSALSDFSDLSGTASTASLVINQTAVGGGAYDHAHGLAQLGATGDLYLACAAVVAEPAPTVNGSNGVTWVRLTASGSTWTVGSTTTHAVSGGAWFGGMVGLSDRVLVGYVPYANGTAGSPTFREWDAGGSLTDPGVGSPSVASFTDATSSLMTFNGAEDGRLWVVFTRNSTTDTPPVGAEPNGWGKGNFTRAFWNGAAWSVNTSETATSRFDPANFQSNAYGLGGLVDPAFEGVVGVVSLCQGTNFAGHQYTLGIFGGALAAAAALEGASVGTGTSTGTLTTSGAAALAGASMGAASSTASLSTSILVAGASVGAEAGAGALTTSIRLAGASAGAASSTGALTTAVQLAGASAGAGSSSASLTAAILLAGASTGAGASSGTLASSGAALAGASVGGEAGAGALTTAILLVGASQGNGSSSGTLTGTATLLAGASVGAASSTGALTTGILLAGASVGAESGTASLGGAAALQGASVGAASSTASLTTAVQLAGASVGGEAGAGALTTGILLAGASVGAGASTGSLEAGAAQLAGASVGAGTSSASLTTGVLLGGASVGAEAGAWALLWGNAATLTPWARWPFDGDSATQVYDATGRVAPLTVRSSGGYPARVLRGASWGWQFSRAEIVNVSPYSAVAYISGHLPTADLLGLISSEWTLSFWVRREAVTPLTNTTATLWSCRTTTPAAGRQHGLIINYGSTSGTLQVAWLRATGPTTSTSGSTNWTGLLPVDGQWHHLVIRRSLPGGVEAAATWGLWLDGVAVAPSTVGSQLGPSAADWWPGYAPAKMAFGDLYGQSSVTDGVESHINGADASLDDFTLYNQACSDAEALALYQAALITGPSARPGTLTLATVTVGAAVASLTLPAVATPTTTGARATPGGPVTVEVSPS